MVQTEGCWSLTEMVMDAVDRPRPPLMTTAIPGKQELVTNAKGEKVHPAITSHFHKDELGAQVICDEQVRRP